MAVQDPGANAATMRVARAEAKERREAAALREVRLVAQVRNGSRGMWAIPPARLPDGQMRDLVAYLRSIDAVR